MPRPWRIRYAGAKYHVTSRGNGRAEVFTGAADYERFLEQLDHAVEEDRVILYAYVLMPNHYHLFLETPRGNLARFMQRLNTAYSMYFRYKKQRPGHCFQGRYGAKLVDGDEYLVRLTRYIHLNPVKVKRYAAATREEKKNALDGWKWSSYRGYAGLGPAEDRVNYRWLPLMGRPTTNGNRAAYRTYVEGLLQETDEVLKEADGRSRYALGDEAFRQEAEQTLQDQMQDTYFAEDVIPAKRRTVDVDDVEETVAKAYGLGREDLHSRRRHAAEAKGVALELCCRLADTTQRALSVRFGYGHESSVGKQRHAIAKRLAEDKGLQRRFNRLFSSF